MNRFEEVAVTSRREEDNVKVPVFPGTDQAVQETACGKAIVVGEHAVVYGARAIAMPLTSMRVNVKVREWGTKGPVRLFLDGKSVSEHLCGVVQDAMRVLQMPPVAIDVEGN